MLFKYSICHPDKKDIEYRNNAISGNDVLKIAEDYPWIQQLNLSESINQNEVYYSPSLDFNCIKNGQSFCLTAIYDEQKKLAFSIWYNRPKKVKVLFGLFGESEKMIVDDYWSLNFDDALKFLQYFVEGKHQEIEKLYKK
ncbi:hypothetical protein OA93_14975 [Flavobacterium sp. KMS]|uniref:hypothetical protein n=1 Tax=Flavobacterium sp. KMS TaxID=1566023 RepID=UPI00057FAB11|nr:hypothetical protein [Flavobacterium sp. KMS]KIA97236.1 hypothetical protein OA93_14975 [Flavobacterium sp. KMS]